MDPFRLCLALAPLATYLLLLGAINLSRRPFVVWGVRDAAFVALAISGMVIVGPIELFFPSQAAANYGPSVWLLLLTLYSMSVVWILQLLLPRLVIYNIAKERLRPILTEVAHQLDAEAAWAGDGLALPTLQVQLYVDDFAAFRSVSLISAGHKQSHPGWRRLESALRLALQGEKCDRNLRGVSLLGVGLLLVAVIVLVVWHHPEAVGQSLENVVQALQEMLGW